MANLFLLLLIATFGNIYGFDSELLPNPRNEESDYNSVCDNPNVTINFSGLQLSRIEENFITSPVITCLDLSNNDIGYVDSKAFNNLPNLKYLNMSSNRFQLQNVFLNTFMNLETLVLDDNSGGYDTDCTDVCQGSYKIQLQSTYPKLRKLFIKSTSYQVRIIAPPFISYLPSLTHLYLSGSKVYQEDFNWLPNTLEYLDLSGHNLRSLSLKNLKNLKWIFLDNPIEKRLSAIHLQNLVSLNYLSAPSNNIEDITSSTFGTVNSLIFLDLSDNNIKYIEGGSLNSMTNLQFLNLSNNNIEIIQGGTFDNLANLKMLALERNIISVFPMIANEIKLEVLTLNCNKLKSIVGGTFIKMPFLEYLYLHDNEISYIDQQAFAGLKNLKILTLSNNMLTSLTPNWMQPMTSIEVLDISGNYITDFEQLGLSDSSSIRNIYLSNQLEFIRSSSLENIPENVTISLKSNYTSIEKCFKSKYKYSQRYGY